MRLYNLKRILKYFSEVEQLSRHSFLEAFTASKLNNSFPIMERALKLLYLYILCPNAS
jgi:hypothetical protein